MVTLKLAGPVPYLDFHFVREASNGEHPVRFVICWPNLVVQSSFHPLDEPGWVLQILRVPVVVTPVY